MYPGRNARDLTELKPGRFRSGSNRMLARFDVIPAEIPAIARQILMIKM